MISRRSHKKSRLGCATCKRRHVKCDEKGPPCGPCTSRSIECEYANTHSEIRHPTPEDDAGFFGTVEENCVPSRRLLELELFHQWASATYKCYCGTIEEEYNIWQIVVPRLALENECLLHGIFAFSALEIARNSTELNPEYYVDVAVHYQTLASSGLREQLSVGDLSATTQEKHLALWALSSILMVLELTLPTFNIQRIEESNMLDHMLVYVELLKGLTVVAWSRLDAIKDDPLLSKYKRWDELSSRTLNHSERAAIDRLMELSEEMYGSTRTERYISELQAISYHAACRRAIFYLEGCLAKCSEPCTRGYCLGWLRESGPDYVSAIKAKEPLALLILMHWAIMLANAGDDLWWAQRSGSRLIIDLLKIIKPNINDKVRDGALWVLEQVGIEYD